MAVTKRTRYEVLKRDNHTCRYCGAQAPDVKLTVDHVTPVALGGSDAPQNLVAACRDCNAGKASTSPDAPLVDDVKQDALRWTRAIQTVTQTMLKDRMDRDTYAEEYETAWERWHYTLDGEKHTIPRAPDWLPTIWQFYSLGLPLAELEDAVIVACSNDRVQTDATWRYFCGVCWRKLDDIQRAAKDYLEAQEVDDGA